MKATMRAFLFLSMAGVLAALIAGSAFAAAAPNITEPSGGLWVGRIAPKHRLTITQSNTVNGDRVSVFAGQGVDVAASLQPSWTVNVNLRGHFAKASAAGFALRPTTTDRPVFTASEIEAAQGVHATVYLQQEGIFIDMIEGGKRMGDALPLTPKLPMPAASYRLGNMKTELPTTSNINTDLQANDWNEDGFSDYMLTYLYLDGSLKVAVAYIDGKSLYEAFTKNDASLIKTSLVDYSTMVTGNGFYDYDRGVIPAASARSAVGDLDGAADGRSEFVLHHTTELTSYSERQIYYGVVGLGTGPGNVLLAWKITPVADAEPGVRFDKIPVDMNSLGEGGNYYNTAELGSDSVGVAVGDVDGDGRAEICALHYRSNRFFLLDMKGDVNVVTNSFLYLFKWQNGGMKCSNPTALPTLDDLDQYRQAFGDVPIGDNMDAAVLYGGSGVFGGQDRYRHSSLRVYSTLTFPGMPQVNYDYDRSGSPIDAVTADLDGDGRDELAWTHTRVINNADYMNPDNSKFMGTKVFLTVHKWPAGDTPRDLGSYTDHELWYPERTGGDRHSGPRHFRNFSMTAGAFNYPSGEGAGPDQRQIAFMNGNWSVWSWNNRNLTKLGERTGASPETDQTLFDVARPLVIAGDLDNESMALGAPVYLQITGGVDTSLIMQAPPKHWDSFTTPDGTSFDADVFAFLSEYSTSFTKDSGETKITSETATTEVRQGGGGSFGLGFASPNKSIPPFLSGGGQAMNDSVKKNTSGNTYTVNITLSAIAATDDQLYFASDNYTIWRYPVLYPESMRTIDIVQDGQTTKGQRFIQFVVPQQGDSAVLAKAGRSLEWYEPLHDNRNLFTYPRDISAIPGFPRGRAVKDPSDPWLDLNGVQIVYSNGNLFGNPDATAMQADIQSQTSKDALETITKTKGGSATFDVGALATGIISGLVEAGTIGLPFKLTSLPIGISAAASFQRDDINTTSSTTTTNASTLQSVMVNWPGVRDMDDSGGWLSVSDRQFTGGIGVYTQDDGTLRVSYSVQQLSNPFSRLWGDKSPYSNYPDPGLLLPYRFNYGGSLNTEDDALRIRGLTFSNDRLDVLPGRTLATKDNVKGHFRIFNYSFVDTQAFTADIFFQPATHDAVGKWSKAPNLSTPESIERIASITVPSIYGRDRDPASDNWRDVVFDWTTPATPGNGFVLVRINYDGNPQQLNADNDRGFVVVGLYNPEDYAASPESAQNARPMAVVNGRAYYAPQDHDLMIESFEVFDAKGNPLDRNALPHDEEFRIEATVYLSSEDGAAATGIPLVHLNMYLNDERHLVASQQLGYLKTGDRHRFTIIYDPVSHREQTGKLEKLELAATSQMLPEHLEGAPENNTALLYFAGSAPTPNTNTGGGGCDAGGIGMLALLFALALSAGKKRG